MERQRGALIIFLILFFFFSPDTSQPPGSQRKQLDDRIFKEHLALESLGNSSYGRFSLARHGEDNATSLLAQDRFSWRLLPEVRKRARVQYLELFLDNGKVSHDDVLKGTEEAYDLASQSSLPFYQNVSGTVQGGFVKCSLGEEIRTPTNLTALAPGNRYLTHEFWRNVTEAEGGLTVQMFEEDKRVGGEVAVREISADVALQTESSPGSGWEMKMFGVHYPKTGSIILTTTSEKFSGIFNLPHFALTRAKFEQTKDLLNRSLSEIIHRQEKSNANEPAFPWSSPTGEAGTRMFSAPSCEYIVYLQQQPVQFTSSKQNSHRLLQLVGQVEKELRFPEGAPMPEVPPMVFTAVVFSPDCGFVLESKGDRDPAKSNFLSGPKAEAFWSLIRQLLLALLIALGLQISLLKRQMDEASTPSMRSRTSYHSIAIMAMGDGLMLASLIAFSMINESGFLILTSAGFLCFFNFAFFEMKFIYDIWLVQVGHHRREDRERPDQPQGVEAQVGAATQPSSLTPSTSSGLPLPVTASRPRDTGATPIILPPDQDVEAAAEEEEGRQITAITGTSPAAGTSVDFQTLYSRFYFTMLVLVFFSLWAFSWPKPLRSAYVNLLCFAYLSFWIPQIYRNVMRNCRQAFTWEYVIGISILRLLPIVYCYTRSSNTLRIATDPSAAAMLAAWVFLQVLAFAIQQFLGPRLFVKESWCPPAYDYHPLLQNDVGDVESGSLLPIGFVASASEAKDKDGTKEKESNNNLKIFDCAICMNEIEVPVVSSKETAERSNLGASWLGRRTYMVTPCRHIFHTECLEGWMRLRLVCPICRESLPPL
jgi:transmembrane E3 ubiquitin-protein ligase